MFPGCPAFLNPMVMAGFTPAGIEAMTPMGVQLRDKAMEFSYGPNRQFWPLDPPAPPPEPRFTLPEPAVERYHYEPPSRIKFDPPEEPFSLIPRRNMLMDLEPAVEPYHYEPPLRIKFDPPEEPFSLTPLRNMLMDLEPPVERYHFEPPPRIRLDTLSEVDLDCKPSRFNLSTPKIDLFPQVDDDFGLRRKKDRSGFEF